MYSLNVPLPGRVHGVIDDLAPLVARLDSPRTDPGLVAKRLGDPEPHELPELERRLRAALEGQAPFELAIDGTGVFAEPPDGEGAVWYIAVESPGLASAHEAACSVVDPVAGLEGPDYVPHVTLGRGELDVVRDLDDDASVGRVTWVANELVVYDSRRGEVVRRLSLPI